MKILFMPTSYPDKQNPVKNVFIYEQAKALAAMGDDICVTHVKKLPSKALFSQVDRNVYKVDDGFAIRYTTNQKTFKENTFPRISRNAFLKSMRRVFEYAIADWGKPDVIYSHFSCWAGYSAVKLGEEYGIPVVNIEHYSAFIKENVNKVMLDGLKETVERAAHNIAVSANLRDAILSKTQIGREITVIPNMVDSSFEYIPLSSHDGFNFCAIGNLNKGKRFGLLIEAFCEAFSADESVTLRIGGAGPEKDNLDELIKSNGREHQIKLLGRLDRAECLELYRTSDCFALPSAFETFGIVWREAMAVGRPVITTDHGGWSAEDWSDDFGIMIDVDDKSALVSALKEMRENYEKYDGVRIAKFIDDNYSSEKISKRLDKIFNTYIRKD